MLKKLSSIALIGGLSAGLLVNAPTAEAATVLFSFSGNGRTVTGQLNGLDRGDVGVSATITNVTSTGFTTNLAGTSFGASMGGFDVDAVTGAVTVNPAGSNLIMPLPEFWILTFNSMPTNPTANLQCLLGACVTADNTGTGPVFVTINPVPIPFNFHSSLGLTLLGLAFVGQRLYKRHRTVVPTELPVE